MNGNCLKALVVGLGFSVLGLAGCSANLIATRGNSRSPDAPVNEKDLSGGIVKLDCGTTDLALVIQKCEEKGRDAMRNYCGGPFRITQNSGTLEGREATETVEH